MEKTLLETKEKLTKELDLTNIMAVPKIEKIVVNVSFGSASPDQKTQEVILGNLKN